MPFYRYRTPIKTAGLLLLFWLSSSFVVVITLRVAPAQAAPTELFFSEYIEGSSNNKALEIFNGTGASVDLSTYRVELYSNGSATASQAVNLSGTLSDGDVFVLAHGAAGSAILAVADLTNSSVVNFNGDDAVALKHNGAIIDVIGQIGLDPGTEWGSGLTSTVNHTLRRKASIEAGDANGSDAFDPAAEWDGFAQDTFDGLGTYLIPTPTPTETATPTSTFTAIATETPTYTPTPTDTSTPIPPTDTPTFTPMPPDTPTATATETVTATATSTLLPGVTDTPTVTGTATITLTVTATVTVALPTDTPTPTPTAAPPSPGDVVINEIVTDPQQNWSANNFNGIPGGGPASATTDEFIELYVKKSNLNLTGWTIELIDTSPVTGNLVYNPGAAFQVINYLGSGSSINTVAGDYLVLGNVAGSGSMNNNILIILKDASGAIIDKVELGSDPEGDGTGDDAPDGTGRGGNATDTADESVIRYPNGTDTNDDVVDFVTGKVTMGSSNDMGVTPTPIPPTPIATVPSTPPPPLLISEFLYDGTTPSTEGDEFVELCNPNPFPVNLAGYKVGDEETPKVQGGSSEGMYELPATVTLAANACLVIAKNAAQFQARFGIAPDFEVGELTKYTAWGTGSWLLANDGDELVVLGGPNDEILDSVAYRNGNYAALGLEAGTSAPEPFSLQRVWPTDTNSMPNDFVRTEPNPGQVTLPPLPPTTILPPAALPDGMYAYWGDLHAHSSYSDGSGPPHYALAMARAAGLHFQAITDHDWRLTSLTWAKILTQTTNATVPGQFVALRGVEWTHETAGHINIFNTNALINNRTDPMFSSLPDLYNWLSAHPDVIAQFNHPDPNYGGTFYNFAYHSGAAQGMFIQEIGNNAQGYTTYEPPFVQSNMAGWRVAPTNNSDHHQAHWGSQSSARTGLVAPALTEGDLLAAVRARRVFATEDSNLAVALRLNGAWMGSSLNAAGPLSLTVDMADPDSEPLTLYVYDSNLLLAAVPLAGGTGQWSATVQARPGHFFWAKVVQADGNTAYTAPVWIEGQAALETLVINEILPAPYDWDWDGDGQADHQDEWVEIYNPTDQPVGLGGWQLADSSGTAYNIPLDGVIPARGFAVFYRALTGFSLNNDAETVTLTHPNGTVVDTFSYTHSPGYDESYCRLPDAGPDWSDNCAPSPQSANGEKVPAGPLTSKIFEAKRLTYNAWVRVKGHITALPGRLGARTMYIQDNTAGIKIYLPKDHRYTFEMGDRVEVVGHLRTFHEEFEIVVSQRGDIKFLEHGEPLPPLPIATTSLLEPYEGMLVMLQGQAVEFKGRNTLWLDDGTGPAKTTILKTTGIKKPFINRGDPLTMVGIVSQYSDEDDPSRHDYRLLPRHQNDLVVAPAAPVPANWPALLPETGN